MAHSTQWIAGALAILLAGTSSAALAQSDGSASDSLVDEIIVTGIRGSLEQAQEVKRRSDVVVEAITSEDLGRFTDRNISDAIKRLPGVSIETNNSGTFAGGTGVTIRGLGPDYSNVTLNGRDVPGIPDFFGNGGRNFDFGAVPSEILSGTVVYKTSSSERIEPGLAGQVDLQTLRPLDFRLPNGGSHYVALSGGFDVEDRAGDFTPRFSGIAVAKFLDDTLGVYVAGLYSRQKGLRDELGSYESTPDFGVQGTDGTITQYRGILTQWGYDFWQARPTFGKRSASAGLQWKPGSNFELRLDALYNDFSTSRDDQSMYYEIDSTFALRGPDPTGTPPDPGAYFRPGGVIFGGTENRGVIYQDTSQIVNAGSGQSVAYQAFFHLRNRSKFFTGGAHLAWNTDDGRTGLSVDYANSHLLFRTAWIRPYAGSPGGETIVDNTGNLPRISVNNVATVADPSTYTYFGFVESFQKQTRQNRNAVRIDLRQEVGDWLTLKAGVNAQWTKYGFISMNYNASTTPTSLANYFDGGSTQLPFVNFRSPTVSFRGFCDANPGFCTQSNFGRGSFEGGFPSSSDGRPGDVLDFNPGESYELRERNIAIYGQGDFKGTIAGLDVSGNVGVRAINLREIGLAFQGTQYKTGFQSAPVDRSITSLLEASNNYWRVLPSFNITVSPGRNINLRYGVSKTISLASYNALAPRGTVTIVEKAPNGTQQPNYADSGNIFLKPTESVNYDLTGEYYTRNGGSYVISLFYKDVSNLLTNRTVLQQPLPGQGDLLFDTNTTINAASGHTYGFEVGGNQPFTFLPDPFKGFGIQANYTFVESKTDQGFGSIPFSGASKHNISGTVYFERGGFSARVSALWRSRYLAGASATTGTYIDAAETIDASLSYKINKNFEVILTGENLTQASRVLRYDKGGYVHFYFQQPRSYSAQLRLAF
jgi:TonB-dependent receptor